jgi:hypothetical protein
MKPANILHTLFYYGDCDEKGCFFDSLQPAVFIDSIGLLSLFWGFS